MNASENTRQGGLERAIGRRSGGAAVKARQLAFAGSYRLLRRGLWVFFFAILPLDLTVVRATRSPVAPARRSIPFFSINSGGSLATTPSSTRPRSRWPRRAPSSGQ